MMLRLAIFDVDGTLVDSQADILASMEAAFGAEGLPAPTRAEVLGIVGLSLPQAMAALAPNTGTETQERLSETYKNSYARLRKQNGAASSPLYPGIRELLEQLHAQENLLLGIATGKSRRGLNALLDTHDLRRFFVTDQCADDHPSKPHPSMLFQAMRDAGVEPHQSVMIGDTSFDIEMGRAARMPTIGVSWGYHPVARLNTASAIVHDVDELKQAIPAAIGGI